MESLKNYQHFNFISYILYGYFCFKKIIFCCGFSAAAVYYGSSKMIGTFLIYVKGSIFFTLERGEQIADFALMQYFWWRKIVWGIFRGRRFPDLWVFGAHHLFNEGQNKKISPPSSSSRLPKSLPVLTMKTKKNKSNLRQESF